MQQWNRTNQKFICDTNSFDLTITTNATVSVGDIILISGVLNTNKDFGFDLQYLVIIEDSEITIE